MTLLRAAKAMVIGALVLVLVLAPACRRPSSPGGHDHGHDHDHGHGDAAHSHEEDGHGDDAHAHEEDGAPTTSFTLFAPTHELFVEMDVPAAGRPVAHHAHVTRLAQYAPVMSGRFTVEWRTADGSRVVASETAAEVARDGIFTPTLAAPEAGTWRLLFRFETETTQVEWDAGEVEVGAEPLPQPPAPEGDITFLKETAWRIPFGVEQPKLQPVRRRVAVAARVEPAPGSTRSVTAPTAGVVAWRVAEGMRVAKDEILGELAPGASSEGLADLELARKQAETEETRLRAELARIQPLIERGLLPERRRADTEAQLAAVVASRERAQREQSLRAGRGGSPMRIVAPMAGVVALDAATGSRAESGAVLARVVDDSSVRLSATLRGDAASSSEPVDAGAILVSSPGWPAPLTGSDLGLKLAASGARLDGSMPGRPLVLEATGGGKLALGQVVELSVPVGAPEERLTIPAEAVVDVNARPVAFVMVSGESFSRRSLVLGASEGGRVAVISGLSPDDRVVTKGSFDVHVASMTGAVESHRH